MRQHRHPARTESGTRGTQSVRATPHTSLRAVALAVGSAVLLAGCGSGSAGPRASSAAPVPSSPSSGTASASSAPPPPSSAVRTTPAPTCSNATRLAGWSDRRLALLTIAVPVLEGSVSGVRTEVGEGVGGLVLFGSYAPADLGAQLAALRAHAPRGSGLLVMTDEEGGGIQRMANLVGSLPWPAWMGAHWSPDRIHQATAQVAARMAAAGVNMNLAPVADVDGSNVPPSTTNPDGFRSFGGDPALVGRATIAYMNGMRSGGVIPVLKHFPGLGGSSGNSDFGPAQTVPWAAEQSIGVPPFADAIAAGAPAVMVSNNTVPGLTSVPAGLSATVINGELRGRLGFHGLVITDALDAKAISAAGYSVPQATVQALKSGADMVMFGLGPDVNGQTSATASAIVSAVNSGELGRARLISAADAILTVQHVDLCRS
ncbi:beta-N-acetylhexosaminidase [Streptacidiphilus sp. MAP12-20]|uniref:glycoside hydrolase family 3 N-terminal domain-containing protein n=1 Tax=Streptacidiphilus sp. MAP12-20 TaxID=3156299 RepID=UPI003519303A